MGTQYNGVGDLPTRPAQVTIGSTTGIGVSPIVVNTNTAHGLTEGDIIAVGSATQGSAANGIWHAHVLSSTTVALLTPVTLANSVGNVANASGVLQAQGLLPTYTEPSDGDARNAQSVNVGLSSLGDRTQYVAQRVGSHKIVGYTILGPTNTSEPATGIHNYTTNAYGGATAFSLGSLTALLMPGDIVTIRGTLAFSSAVNENVFFKLKRGLGGSAAADFTGQQRLTASAFAVGAYLSIPICCTETLAANTAAGSYDLYLDGRGTTAQTVSLLSDSTFEITAIRPN